MVDVSVSCAVSKAVRHDFRSTSAPLPESCWLEQSRWPTKIINDDPSERARHRPIRSPNSFLHFNGKINFEASVGISALSLVPNRSSGRGLQRVYSRRRKFFNFRESQRTPHPPAVLVAVESNEHRVENRAASLRLPPAFDSYSTIFNYVARNDPLLSQSSRARGERSWLYRTKRRMGHGFHKTTRRRKEVEV